LFFTRSKTLMKRILSGATLVLALLLVAVAVAIDTGAEPIEYAGMITGGNGSYTHWRSDATVTLSGERWSGTWGVQYIGKADDINTDTGPGSKVSGVFYHNAQLGYRVTDSIEVAAGVDNLFDKDAPYVASWTDGNTDTLTYDLLGRRWYLRASWSLQ
jgi:iron complex outermembrane recepter protein